MRKIATLVLLLFSLCSPIMADSIVGFWQTMNKKTQLPSSVIAIYNYQGKYYGRIVATFNEDGNLYDTMYHPKDIAPGIVGDRTYCGLDIVYNVVQGDDDDSTYSGYIVDPKKGNVYNAKLWRDKENLILRGEVLIFGKNITWPPFPEDGFNADFKKPDLSTFVPIIPKTK